MDTGISSRHSLVRELSAAVGGRELEQGQDAAREVIGSLSALMRKAVESDTCSVRVYSNHHGRPAWAPAFERELSEFCDSLGLQLVASENAWPVNNDGYPDDYLYGVDVCWNKERSRTLLSDMELRPPARPGISSAAAASLIHAFFPRPGESS